MFYRIVTSEFLSKSCHQELRGFDFFNVENTEEGEIDQEVNHRGDDEAQHDGQGKISPGILYVLNVGRDSLPPSIGPVASIYGFHVITLETFSSSQSTSVGWAGFYINGKVGLGLCYDGR